MKTIADYNLRKLFKDVVIIKKKKQQFFELHFILKAAILFELEDKRSAVFQNDSILFYIGHELNEKS